MHCRRRHHSSSGRLPIAILTALLAFDALLVLSVPTPRLLRGTMRRAFAACRWRRLLMRDRSLLGRLRLAGLLSLPLVVLVWLASLPGRRWGWPRPLTVLTLLLLPVPLQRRCALHRWRSRLVRPR